jgi:hypothetical protein
MNGWREHKESQRRKYTMKNRPVPQWRVIGVWVLTALAVGFLADEFMDRTRKLLLPKNLVEVRKGVLYRAGIIREDQFADVLAKNHIRSVISLTGTEFPFESEFCQRQGVNFFNFCMPGDGRGKPEDFHQVVRIIAQPHFQPVLVHCAAGAYRSGVAVALYRTQLEGWDVEDAIRELEYTGCPIQFDVPLQEFIRDLVRSVPPDIVAIKNPIQASAIRAASRPPTNDPK